MVDVRIENNVLESIGKILDEHKKDGNKFSIGRYKSLCAIMDSIARPTDKLKRILDVWCSVTVNINCGSCIPRMRGRFDRTMIVFREVMDDGAGMG